MSDLGIIGLILIAANVVFSYLGFRNSVFFEKYKFEVDKILVDKQYYRVLTSGFLHVSWSHLLFNMVSLYAFSEMAEIGIGKINFLIVYFSSLMGGDLFSLFIHRNHGDYSAVGASGAVSGIIFASIALFPGIEIGMFGLPFLIPGWCYGIFFVLISIYGIKSKSYNIGHDAHLGGALVGMLVVLLIQPSAFRENAWIILLIFIPMLIFVYLIITRPQILLIDNFHFKAQKKYESIDYKFNERKHTTQQEIDKILDKINEKGMDSLSKKEKQMLTDYSKK